MAEVEAAFQRITNHKGVSGILIVDDEGRELRTTLSSDLTEKYSELIPQLAAMARSAIRDLDPSNDLQFLRIRSTDHEIMVAPEKEFTLICIQEPTSGD